MDYNIKDLEKWNYRIEEIAKNFGLDYYPQEFEIIDYSDMLAYEVYLGMPARYPHWSFGKAYDRLKTLYQYNFVGLPYEMVINSNPCIAYLMKDNTLLLQILTIAHVYGHNDFFKNNRLFAEATDANYTIEMFKSNGDRIRQYINDPSIGYEEVEKILDAAHAIKLQTDRAIGVKKLSITQLKDKIIREYKNDNSHNDLLKGNVKKPIKDINKVPLEPEEDILGFIINYGELYEWQKDIVQIVKEETKYFIPQIETKIMNEGWASFWHYNILKELKLPQGLHLEFMKRHNDVITPLEGRVNPYYMGFKIYENLYHTYGWDKIFQVRLLERDESFIRRYLTEELCYEMNLFQYGKHGKDYTIEEVSDERGFKEIKNTLCESCGIGMIPHIVIADMNTNNKILTLEHKFDGRELEMSYTMETLKYLVDLWKHKIILKTTLNGKDIDIVCDIDKQVSYV
ncbi:SpoVR family protein [Clostridium rectalis]|uniref:SpoVR family protein n=1 Tax=Clostridium rectalis TaxID=2040295 RepID=UPI000F62DD28|nr:SpoVR family protein [Clostridium rectalis]